MPVALPIAVVLNDSAGTVGVPSEIANGIRTLLGAAGRDVDIVSPRAGDNVTEIARDLATRASIVVAAGGDGTVRSVAAGVLDSPAALGVLPLGTLNHFAKDLGIPLQLPEAVTVLAEGHVGRVDVGRVNGHVFVNNSSIGVYPSVVEAREALRRQGHGKWMAMAIATVRVLRRHSEVTVRIDVDGRVRTRRTPFIFVGNNEYAIEGIRLGGRERLDGGRLFVYLSPHVRTRELPLLAVKALAGRAAGSGAFEIVAGADVRIETFTRRGVKVAFDGEVATIGSPLHYRIAPRALRVVVPRS
jgi:diacylglycerol kinase family enzyme